LALATAAAAMASLAVSGSALADQASGGGVFVIGDQNAVVGSHVTFWDSQWWKDNTLTFDVSPAAFKGYALNASLTCGVPWTTTTGNSSDPPPTLPAVIPVIVSDQITQSGSIVSGDTTEVVDVAVDPGYAGDPGHAGTGTVLGFECGGTPPT
jgi:hypothetical protein